MMQTNDPNPLFELLKAGFNELMPKLQEMGQEVLKQMKEEMPQIKEEGKQLWSDIKKDFQEEYRKFLDDIKTEPMKNLYVEEVEFLKSDKLVAIAKQYVVEGSNEVYVWKQQTDTKICVHITYGKNREPLEQANNKFVVIKCEGLSLDVQNLFSESELVILT